MPSWRANETHALLTVDGNLIAKYLAPVSYMIEYQDVTGIDMNKKWGRTRTPTAGVRFMAYGMYRAARLAIDYALQLGIEYDVFVRARPDLMQRTFKRAYMWRPGPCVTACCFQSVQQRVIYTFHGHPHGGGGNDNFFWARPSTYLAVINLYHHNFSRVEIETYRRNLDHYEYMVPTAAMMLGFYTQACASMMGGRIWPRDSCWNCSAGRPSWWAERGYPIGLAKEEHPHVALISQGQFPT